MKTTFIGKRVIVRGDRSGVFFGTLQDKDGTDVKLSNVRRLWQWAGATDCLELAKYIEKSNCLQEHISCKKG